jgi:hypothetical protein
MMQQSWLRPALAVVVSLVAGAGVSTAQTVIVRSAPPGGTVELMVNAAPSGTTAADSEGDATMPVPRAADAAARDVDTLVFVDACGNRRRIHLVERTAEAAAPEPSCVRREIPGVFVVRSISTIVVNVGGASPTLLLIQGTYDPKAPPKVWLPVPTGIVASGGAGFTWFGGKVGQFACGNVPDCSIDDSGIGFTASAAYWISKYLAAEFTYVKPGDMTAKGAGGTYRFESTLDAHVFNIAGKIGGPVGPMRLYGMGGTNYHRATFATSQTIDDAKAVIDGVEHTIPGGTQVLEFRTAGWGWTFGGGAEVWISRWLGIYADFSRMAIKGSDQDDGEWAIDDGMTTILIGARIHIGR